MNEIVKVYQDNPMRIIEREGEPWFVVKDVCRILELDMASGARGLEDDEKGLHIMQTPGGEQKVQIVSEPGLYRLIFKSRKKEAKNFKHWVLHDVLPGIRKNGAYLSPAITDDQMKSLVSTLEQEIYRRIEAENRVGLLERQVEKLALRAIPKRRFGEISEKTGLPMDKIIPPHVRSDRRPHEPQFGKYIQLLLPLYAARELLENNAYPLLEFAND